MERAPLARHRGKNARLKHIGEALARPLEPPEPAPRNREANGEMDAPLVKVQQVSPNHDFPGLLDYKCEGVEHQQSLVALGQGGQRVEDRGQEHEHGGKNSRGLRNVPHIDARGGQEPGKTHGYQQ